MKSVASPLFRAGIVKCRVFEAEGDHAENREARLTATLAGQLRTECALIDALTACRGGRMSTSACIRGFIVHVLI